MNEEASPVYRLLPKAFPSKKGWDSFSIVAINGWCRRTETGHLALTRPGPFIPPITFPESVNAPHPQTHELVVTNVFKQHLEQSHLGGFTFLPVIKYHSYQMEWEAWVLSGSEPPENTEPNEAIFHVPRQLHDPAVAEQMGDLWEIRLEDHGEWGKKEPGSPFIVNWDGTDWFYIEHPPGNSVYCYVSERAMQWLKQTVGKWVGFRGMSASELPSITNH